MVAAYFGWGVILALQEKRTLNEPMNATTHSISFVWLGSMMLFVLYPSLVCALIPADMVSWGMSTCYMTGLGSVISAYFVCMALEKKVNPTYIYLRPPYWRYGGNRLTTALSGPMRRTIDWSHSWCNFRY